MKKVESKLSSLLTKNNYELRDLQSKSRAWFAAEVRNMRSAKVMNHTAIMAGDNDSKGTRVLPGTMVLFEYDPKYKETLPYYDTLPLVLPFNVVPGGFYGLNLHYLPYDMRAKLLDRLMEFRSTKGITDRTRLRMNWELLNGVSRFAAAKPCVKHYLYEQVMTPFKAINPKDWASAIMLPLERFEKNDVTSVWANSLRIIRS